LNLFDLVAGGLLAWNTLSGLRQGFIREVVGFAALVIGAIAAGRYYDELSANIAFAIENETLRNLVAAAAIFGGIALIGSVVSGLLKTVAAVLMLGPLDHLGGALFGLLKGFLLVELLIIVAAAFPAFDMLTSAVNGSTLAPYFLEAAPLVQRLLPEQFDQAIAALKENLETVLPGTPGGATPSATP
jgi:membrane protein required for colicin V production